MFIIFGSLGFWLFCYCFYAVLFIIKIFFLAIPFMIMFALKIGAFMVMAMSVVLGVMGTVAIGIIKFVIDLIKSNIHRFK